jgi:hypothetical protein
MMGFKLCEHFCVKCSKCKNYIDKDLNEVAVIVLAGLSEERSCLIDFMQINLFAGMIGGVPDKAHFFFGFEKYLNLSKKPQLLYLDPHKVTSAKNIKNNDYQCTDYLTVGINEIDMSVGLCFYFRAPEDIVHFKYKVDEIESKYPKNMPFTVQNR